MNIAVIRHPDRKEASLLAEKVEAGARARGLVVTGSSVTADIDVVIAIGGDGTMLEAVRRALVHDRPVLGVNVGHVGYLAAVDPQQLDDALDLIAAGSWEESHRMTMEATCGDATAIGLNDVVIEKAVSQHAVRIALQVDDRHFTTYRADGLVIASPTGSTAYAFSAGGPMVDPELEVIVVTPVAAHNLFAPTVLFGPDATLRFRSVGGRAVRVNVDGRQVATISGEDEIRVRKGPRPARFVVPWERPFDQVVREKFGLDGD